MIDPLFSGQDGSLPEDLPQLSITASASISTNQSGSMNRETSMMVVAGPMSRKKSPLPLAAPPPPDPPAADACQQDPGAHHLTERRASLVERTTDDLETAPGLRRGVA